ncbi:hypothetical protein SY88_09520 [Clostridiales bacterium PH28_bin88]|nr:hypothetical protein SY88_09520 [Clostridiales bacterium PH28_bin88]
MGKIPLRVLLVMIAVMLVLALAGGAALAHGGAKEEPAAGEPVAEEHVDEEPAGDEHADEEPGGEEPMAMPGGPRASTNLTLSIEKNGEESARALATLTDQDGQPVPGAKLTFFRKTTFGRLKLGTVSTDGMGIGSTSVPVYAGQEVEVTAAFAGNKELAPVEAVASLSLPPAPAPPRSRMLTQRPDPRFVFVLLLVIGGVWTAYAYVFLLLARIKRAGALEPV